MRVVRNHSDFDSLHSGCCVHVFCGGVEREAELPGPPKHHLRRQVNEGSTESS